METGAPASLIERLGIYWILFLGGVIGTGGVILLESLTAIELSLVLKIMTIVGCSLASAALGIAWIFLTPAVVQPFEGPLPPVKLSDFLNQPGALIGPNLDPEESDQLCQWLEKFSEKHGENSVWIIPLPDGNDADRVLFLVEYLTDEDRTSLEQFHVDTVSEIEASIKEKLLPDTNDGHKLYEAVWD